MIQDIDFLLMVRLTDGLAEEVCRVGLDSLALCCAAYG